MPAAFHRRWATPPEEGQAVFIWRKKSLHHPGDANIREHFSRGQTSTRLHDSPCSRPPLKENQKNKRGQNTAAHFCLSLRPHAKAWVLPAAPRTTMVHCYPTPKIGTTSWSIG